MSTTACVKLVGSYQSSSIIFVSVHRHVNFVKCRDLHRDGVAEITRNLWKWKLMLWGSRGDGIKLCGIPMGI